MERNSNLLQVKKRIIDFCNNKKESVILLKGNWGIGKTFLIDTIQTEEKDLNFRYVSLFGLSNLNEVKTKIINSSDRESFLRKNFSEVVKGSNTATVGAMLANMSANAFDLIAEKKLTNQIIILDDFERKEATLTNIMILGLIDYLKFKNNKVILLTNEEKINIEDDLSKNEVVSESWQILKEKSIDCEIKLIIDQQDCLNILLPHKNKLDLEYEVILKFLIETKLINLRITKLIINKLEDFFSTFKSYLNSENKSFIIDILSNFAKVLYIYYSQSNYKDYFHYYKISLKAETKLAFLFKHSQESNEYQSFVSFFDNLSISSSYSEVDIFPILENFIEFGFLDTVKLKNKVADLFNNWTLENNQQALLNFVDKVMYQVIPSLEFEEKVLFFLNAPIKEPGTIFLIYQIIKKINNPSYSNLLNDYKIKIQELTNVLDFHPSFYTENSEFFNAQKREQEDKISKVLSSLFDMLAYCQDEEFVIKYLNGIDSNTLDFLLKMELAKDNIKAIMQFLNRLKENNNYKNFNSILNEYINNLDANSDLKRIFILNYF